MSAWCFYHPTTGVISRKKFEGPRGSIEKNTPNGMAAIKGDYDPLSQRVDIQTLKVVPYQRPAAEVEAEQRAARSRQARQHIDRLERAQLRPMRELALDPNNGQAKQRLQEIEDEIAAKREDLRP